MKSLKIFISLFILASALVQCQQINQEFRYAGNPPILLGKINQAGLRSNHYKTWFEKNYSAYQLDLMTLEKIRDKIADFQITVFMGTWCGDSKRQVPAFYKVLNALNYPMNQLTVIAVSNQEDAYKQAPQHEEAGLNIHRVPTFIFYKNGVEKNRIVEEPVKSFEKDILRIITEDNYQSHYYLITELHLLLKEGGIAALIKAKDELTANYKNKVSSIYELNTYAKVLLSKGKTKEAIEVLKLNMHLFPEIPKTYQNLAKTYLKLDMKTASISILEKAIQRFPNHSIFSQRLKELKTD